MDPLEILKNAILMERQGKAFYEEVASVTKSDAVRNIFTFMAKEEGVHIEQLSEQYVQFKNENAFKVKEFPNGDSGFIERILTTGICQQINAASFEAAAISAAIDFESKAIEVYSQSALKATDAAQKAIYTWLADWERGHHRILNQLNNELKEAIWYDNKFWPF
ncbi:MAG: ferritin family protein [Bacteroidota bacterium]|nr:ferritin family protein [Bacteroidota bacterium]